MKQLTEISRRLPANFKVSGNLLKQIIRDEFIPTGSGYQVVIERSLIGWIAVIEFDNFAGWLVKRVKNTLHNKEGYIRELIEGNDALSFRLHRHSSDTLFKNGHCGEIGIWIEISFTSEEIKADEIFIDNILMIMVHLFSYQVDGESEGTQGTVLQTKIERSFFNRFICLAAHGYSCKACGVNFKKMYGSSAESVIHVHHINPLSSNIAVVDPINDMIPLCPNCHAVVHVRNPPYKIQDLKDMMDNIDYIC